MPHKRLVVKLGYYGIRGATQRWIQAFRTDRPQQVLVEGANTNSIPVVSGAPQRTVLGPLLFLLCISSLSDCVQSRTWLLADKCILYIKIKSQQDCDLYRNFLDWRRNGVWPSTLIKAAPSDFLGLESQALGTTHQRDVLATDDSTRYLGVELQSNIAWYKHMDQTIKKGNSMLGFLGRHLKVSHESTKTAAYSSLIRSILEYCCTVWIPHTQEYINKLEMVQRRAARYALQIETIMTVVSPPCWITLNGNPWKPDIPNAS